MLSEPCDSANECAYLTMTVSVLAAGHLRDADVSQSLVRFCGESRRELVLQ
jgi:hypothetical protein